MAHIDHQETIRGALISHRDRVAALLARLDANPSCADLLNEMHACHRAFGQFYAELLVEHIKHHLAEESDPGKREQAAGEIIALLHAAG